MSPTARVLPSSAWLCLLRAATELMQVTEVWVDTALQLGEKSLRTMERLVRAQQKRPAVVESVPAQEMPSVARMSAAV